MWVARPALFTGHVWEHLSLLRCRSVEPPCASVFLGSSRAGAVPAESISGRAGVRAQLQVLSRPECWAADRNPLPFFLGQRRVFRKPRKGSKSGGGGRGEVLV